MLQAWIRTVISFRYYHLLTQISVGRLGLFALWLILISVLVFNTYFTVQLQRYLPPFLKSLPEITFSQGKLIQPEQRLFVPIAPTNYQLLIDKKLHTPPTQQEFFEQNIIAVLSENAIYIPSVASVQTQPLPSTWNATLNAQTIEQYRSAISSTLQVIIFFGSALSSLFFLLGSTLLARMVLALWRGMRRQPVPSAILWKWAILLQGPAFILWIFNLFVTVPLFLFALFILFMMYSQQIFNTLPEK